MTSTTMNIEQSIVIYSEPPLLTKLKLKLRDTRVQRDIVLGLMLIVTLCTSVLLCYYGDNERNLPEYAYTDTDYNASIQTARKQCVDYINCTSVCNETLFISDDIPKNCAKMCTTNNCSLDKTISCSFDCLNVWSTVGNIKTSGYGPDESYRRKVGKALFTIGLLCFIIIPFFFTCVIMFLNVCCCDGKIAHLLR